MVIYHMQKKCRIIIKNFEIIVKLNSSLTAEKIWNSLPIISKTNTWGKEIYFYTSIEVELEKESKDVVEFGEIVYWPSGKAIAIGFGKTPASIDKEIRLADKCNIWGDCSIELQNIKTIKSGDKIFVEKCQ